MNPWLYGNLSYWITKHKRAWFYVGVYVHWSSWTSQLRTLKSCSNKGVDLTPPIFSRHYANVHMDLVVYLNGVTTGISPDMFVTYLHIIVSWGFFSHAPNIVNLVLMVLYSVKISCYLSYFTFATEAVTPIFITFRNIAIITQTLHSFATYLTTCTLCLSLDALSCKWNSKRKERGYLREHFTIWRMAR